MDFSKYQTKRARWPVVHDGRPRLRLSCLSRWRGGTAGFEDFIYEYGGDEYGDDEAGAHWTGGFLNADIAIVTIVGEKDDKEWHCHYSIDLRTGTPLGRFEAHSRDREDFEPLGDGTWIVSGPDGSPIRGQCSELSDVVRT